MLEAPNKQINTTKYIVLTSILFSTVGAIMLGKVVYDLIDNKQLTSNNLFVFNFIAFTSLALILVSLIALKYILKKHNENKKAIIEIENAIIDIVISKIKKNYELDTKKLDDNIKYFTICIPSMLAIIHGTSEEKDALIINIVNIIEHNINLKYTNETKKKILNDTNKILRDLKNAYDKKDMRSVLYNSLKLLTFTFPHDFTSQEIQNELTKQKIKNELIEQEIQKLNKLTKNFYDKCLRQKTQTFNNILLSVSLIVTLTCIATAGYNVISNTVSNTEIIGLVGMCFAGFGINILILGTKFSSNSSKSPTELHNSIEVEQLQNPQNLQPS